MLPEPTGRTSTDALVTWTNVIYLLHAFSLLALNERRAMYT